MRRHYELLKYLHSDRRATDRNLSVRRTSSGRGGRAPERITPAEVAGTKRISVRRTKPILGFEQQHYPAYVLRVPARNAIISSAVYGRRLPPDISYNFFFYFFLFSKSATWTGNAAVSLGVSDNDRDWSRPPNTTTKSKPFHRIGQKCPELAHRWRYV